MFSKEFYKENNKVWIEHPKRAWEKASIIGAMADNYPILLMVQIEDSTEMRSLIINSTEELPLLCLPEDEQCVDSIDNLSTLAFPREPSVFHVLCSRFAKKLFYTYCNAQTLIFLNPCGEVPIGESEAIFKRHGQTLQNLEPHVFSIAEKAYRRLERDKNDQTIIFSGESGSGKTENAKCAVVYLTTHNSKDSSIKEKILATLILLEAFGNVKTVNSCSSSRFGKFLQLQYNMNQQLIGAVLQTYFLDTSKLVFQAENEQNFDIFSQMYAMKDRFPYLSLNEAPGFSYLKNVDQTNSDGSAVYFFKTVNAMRTLGLSDAQQKEIFCILSALLYLGNADFRQYKPEVDSPTDSCFINNTRCLDKALQLLEVDVGENKRMRQLFCFRGVFSQESEILRPQSVEEAEATRDAFARHIYSMLFNWLVMRINASLRSPCEVQGSIGILDLCGFEKLETNSLEQFWINYANEKLEQSYHWSTFYWPQMRCLNDKIAWIYIDIVDNSSCVELLEGRNGVVDVLCDKTRMLQRCMDANSSWIQDLEKKCGRSENFRRIYNTSDFVILHFLDDVRYDSNGFVEKNSYATIKELLNVLKETKNVFLKKLVQQELLKLTPAATSKKRMSIDTRVSTNRNLNCKTVLSDFRNSLTVLASKLQKANPYYVRCIKTDGGSGLGLHPVHVAHQLRAYKVNETLEISAFAFTSQFRFERFVQRYHCLCQYEVLQERNVQKTCLLILQIHVEDSRHYVMGVSRIFLKEESVEHLEQLRADRQHRASIVVQRAVRRYVQQKRFVQIRQAVQVLQRQTRQFLSRRRLRRVLEEQAAVKIQRRVRTWLVRRCKRPGQTSREEDEEHRKSVVHTVAAVTIQRWVRGFLARRKLGRRQRNVVLVQACARRFLAQLTATRLRRERERIVPDHPFSLENAQELGTIIGPQKSDMVKNLDRYFLEKIQVLRDIGGQKMCGTLKSPMVECKKHKIDTSIILSYNSYNEDTLNIDWEEEMRDAERKLNRIFRNFDKHAQAIVLKYGISQSEIMRVRASREEEEDLLLDTEMRNESVGESVLPRVGMFQFNLMDLDNIMHYLVSEINYLKMEENERCLLVPILFMSIRYLDILNDSQTSLSLVEGYARSVQQVAKAQPSLEPTVFWLAQTHRLFNLARQYSRPADQVDDDDDDENDEAYHAENTASQNAKSLHYLELRLEREVLEELGQWLARRAAKQMKLATTELVVPSLLSARAPGDGGEPAVRLLLDELAGFHELFQKHHVERMVEIRVFEQLFAFHSSLALSSFMAQTEAFNSVHATIVRCNIRSIESWALGCNLLLAVRGLAPLTQAVRLLQRLPINAFEVDRICKDYNKLTFAQMQNLLRHYKPADYEEPISSLVIQAVKMNLVQGLHDYDDTILLDDVNDPIEFPFQHSNINFEEVEIPAAYNFHVFKKI